MSSTGADESACFSALACAAVVHVKHAVTPVSGPDSAPEDSDQARDDDVAQTSIVEPERPAPQKTALRPAEPRRKQDARGGQKAWSQSESTAAGPREKASRHFFILFCKYSWKVSRTGSGKPWPQADPDSSQLGKAISTGNLAKPSVLLSQADR